MHYSISTFLNHWLSLDGMYRHSMHSIISTLLNYWLNMDSLVPRLSHTQTKSWAGAWEWGYSLDGMYTCSKLCTTAILYSWSQN